MAHISPATEEGLARAADIICRGGIVGLPTETVYGLAVDAFNAQAIAKVFAAKGRPTFNPLISHVYDVDMAREHGAFNTLAQALADAFWPGPLTIVVPRKAGSPVHALATAGLDTIALRVPAHPVAQAVLERIARPLAAPSANPSGKLSPTRAQHVIDSMTDKVDMVLDGGACDFGLESTVVSATAHSATLLREGAITREQLREVCPITVPEHNEMITSPGQLLAHYAPDKPLRLEAHSARQHEMLIGFGGVQGDLTLSADGSLVEAAAALFDVLAQANKSPAAAIAVAPIPQKGLGRAINDRLRRAAHGSPAHAPSARQDRREERA
ncbi:MAG: L-threonylcarbamoyladenylate synthase [Pseudomonadota bacterium]